MIVARIHPHTIRGIQVKKGVLSAVESYWSEKTFEKKLIEGGKFTSVELITSALKESLSVGGRLFKDTEVTVVLDHDVYTFFRTEIPLETDKTAYHVFLKEQFQKHHHIRIEEYAFEMFVREFENKKIGFVYALPRAQLTIIDQALDLLDFKLAYVVPEHLAYFTIFERTLRLDKHEHILFTTYENKEVTGLVYDTYGPLPEIPPWSKKSVAPTELEAFLRQKADEFAQKAHKFNRMIITGSDADAIRQDTFTKNVGVWTNPLKRIVPQFYKEFLMQIEGKDNPATAFPILSYSDLFGAYVAIQEAKAFPYAKIGSESKTVAKHQSITHSPQSSMLTTETPKKFRFPKEILLFVLIFIVTFGVFYVIAQGRSGGGVTLPFAVVSTPTPTPEPTEPPPTPTPTIEVKREEVSVRVLNGTGVAGQAGVIKSLLESKGYEDITTGNAASYDYLQSEVQVDPEKSYLKEVVAEDIASSIGSPAFVDQTGTPSADVIIVIGADIK